MIDYELVQTYCLSKPYTQETYPFGQEPLVVKVGGKMFALISPDSVSLKCDPAIALNLREQNPEAIKPGYHLNKKHWNTIMFGPIISEEEIQDMIDHSYELVVRGLTKAQREQMGIIAV
jgi:predicted DNA-binding protein (MmcQ/YjbR family)